MPHIHLLCNCAMAVIGVCWSRGWLLPGSSSWAQCEGPQATVNAFCSSTIGALAACRVVIRMIRYRLHTFSRSPCIDTRVSWYSIANSTNLGVMRCSCVRREDPGVERKGADSCISQQDGLPTETRKSLMSSHSDSATARHGIVCIEMCSIVGDPDVSDGVSGRDVRMLEVSISSTMSLS